MSYPVSVIVPVYGVEKYIEQCAQSLFEQDFSDIEYIFVNDCTPDKSIAVLEHIIKKHPDRKPHITILHHRQNQGLGSARHTGVKCATGDYIIHIDSDDWCEPDMISSLYTQWKADNADIVVCDFFENDANSQRQIVQPYVASKKANNHNLLVGNPVVSTCNKLIKRSLYVDNDIYPPQWMNFSEDRYLSTQLFLLAEKVSYVPRAFLHYRQNNAGSLTKSLGEKARQDLHRCSTSLEQFLHMHWLFEEYRESFYVGILAVVLSYSNGLDYKKKIQWICPQADKFSYVWKLPYTGFIGKIVHSITVMWWGFFTYWLIHFKNFYRSL